MGRWRGVERSARRNVAFGERSAHEVILCGFRCELGAVVACAADRRKHGAGHQEIGAGTSSRLGSASPERRRGRRWRPAAGWLMGVPFAGHSDYGGG
jgi:hypothetical protein